jgi:hypothetical protein
MQDEQKIKSSQHGVSNPAAMKLEGKTTPMTAAALDPHQILKNLKCFLHGKWNAHWWGWTVWIDTHCAHTFSDILKAGVAPGLKCRFQCVKGIIRLRSCSYNSSVSILGIGRLSLS